MQCPNCKCELELTLKNNINIIDDGLSFDHSKLDDIGSVSTIILHHSVSPANWTTSMIHASHLQRGWAGIGYHYIIEYDGTIKKGRPDNKAGAHCRGHNYHTLGICLIGNFEKARPSPAQISSIKKLIKYLIAKCKICTVLKHNDIDTSNACPGKLFNLQEVLEGLSNDNR